MGDDKDKPKVINFGKEKSKRTGEKRVSDDPDYRGEERRIPKKIDSMGDKLDTLREEMKELVKKGARKTREEIENAKAREQAAKEKDWEMMHKAFAAHREASFREHLVYYIGVGIGFAYVLILILLSLTKGII